MIKEQKIRKMKVSGTKDLKKKSTWCRILKSRREGEGAKDQKMEST